MFLHGVTVGPDISWMNASFIKLCVLKCQSERSWQDLQDRILLTLVRLVRVTLVVDFAFCPKIWEMMGTYIPKNECSLSGRDTQTLLAVKI